MKNYSEGDEVFWEDPDDGACSGVYTVIGYITDEFSGAGVYVLENGQGSQTQAFEWEIS